MNDVVPVVKDLSRQHAVPSAWRQTLTTIVDALAAGDYQLKMCGPGVEILSEADATLISRNITAYGEVLTPLPQAAWDSSVCQWMGSDWVVLVDLFTVAEGRSDLVLHLHVRQAGGGYTFQVHLVYVP